MGKLSNQRMKQVVGRYRDQMTGREYDKCITLGMYLAEVVLANEFGWGKERLGRLEAGVHALCKVEIAAGAEKFTADYNHNLGYGFAKIAQRLDQIHGEGHCDWMKDLRFGR